MELLLWTLQIYTRISHGIMIDILSYIFSLTSISYADSIYESNSILKYDLRIVGQIPGAFSLLYSTTPATTPILGVGPLVVGLWMGLRLGLCTAILTGHGYRVLLTLWCNFISISETDFYLRDSIIFEAGRMVE